MKSAEVLPTSQNQKKELPPRCVAGLTCVEVGTATADFNVPSLPRPRVDDAGLRLADCCWTATEDWRCVPRPPAATVECGDRHSVATSDGASTAGTLSFRGPPTHRTPRNPRTDVSTLSLPLIQHKTQAPPLLTNTISQALPEPPH